MFKYDLKSFGGKRRRARAVDGGWDVGMGVEGGARAFAVKAGRRYSSLFLCTADTKRSIGCTLGGCGNRNS